MRYLTLDLALEALAHNPSLMYIGVVAQDTPRIGNIPYHALSRAMYVCADYELTGVKKALDVLVEAAHIFCDVNGRMLGDWESIIDPERDTGAVDVHHITNEMVRGKPTFAEIAVDLAEMLDGKILVSNNNGLDIAALTRQFDECGIIFNPGKPIDITDFATDSVFVDRYEKLLTEVFMGEESVHRAMPDARQVAEILPSIVEYIMEHPERVRSFEPCRFHTRNVIRTL